MYLIQQAATCSKCGHKRPSNGTDDDHLNKVLHNHNGNEYRFTVCPKCFEKMLTVFCGAMVPDRTYYGE